MRVLKSIFALALPVREILIFLTFDLDNLAKGYVVENLDLRRLIANIKLRKNHTKHFRAISCRIPDIKYHDFQKCCDLENICLFQSYV